MFILFLALMAFVVGGLALVCVAAADTVSAEEHHPWTIWPIAIFGVFTLLLTLLVLGITVGIIFDGKGFHRDNQLDVVAGAFGVALFGPLGVLLVLLSQSLKDRHTASRLWRPRTLRSLITAFGYVLICGAPTIVFPPLAGLVIGALFAGLAYLRRARHSQFLWLLTIAVERQFPLVPELQASGEAIGGRIGGQLIGVAELLEDGLPLSRALAHRDSLVPRPAVLAARVGEQTGTLAQTLRDAAIRSSGDPSQGNQAAYLTGVVTYFWVIAMLFIGVVGFCMYYIVPKFKEIFYDFGVELPAVSVLLINASDLFVHWWFVGVPLVLTLLALSIMAGECYRRGWQNLSLPWLTRWFPRLDTPEILRNLSRAVETNTPLTDVLDTLANHHHRPHIAEKLAVAAHEIDAGQDPWESLQRARLLRGGEVELLQSATTAGNLGWGLRDVAERIERRRTQRLQWWFEVLRPWPILILGLMAAMFAFGMFLPLVKLLNELS